MPPKIDSGFMLAEIPRDIYADVSIWVSVLVTLVFDQLGLS
jgi:hypothetical protein